MDYILSVMDTAWFGYPAWISLTAFSIGYIFGFRKVWSAISNWFIDQFTDKNYNPNPQWKRTIGEAADF